MQYVGKVVVVIVVVDYTYYAKRVGDGQCGVVNPFPWNIPMHVTLNMHLKNYCEHVYRHNLRLVLIQTRFDRCIFKLAVITG